MEKSDGEIFKISKDEERAKNLLDMAKERRDIIIKFIPKELTYKLLEEYYEVAVQLITSIMYAEGYKTLSHIGLISYLKEYREFSNHELETLDNMRKFRHGAVYYGSKVGGNFFVNHENEIKSIINKLKNLVENKLKTKILVSLFKKVQAIPYQVSKFVKEEINEDIKYGDCRHKSELLFQLLKKDNFEVRKLKVIFDWQDLPIPKEMLSLLKKSGTVWDHDILTVKIIKNWVKIDCTWNKELKSKGFPVTEYWDGRSDTLQVTKGKLEFYDAEKYKKTINIDKEEAHKFADELNKWLKTKVESKPY